jgi:hypothetical protein
VEVKHLLGEGNVTNHVNSPSTSPTSSAAATVTLPAQSTRLASSTSNPSHQASASSTRPLPAHTPAHTSFTNNTTSIPAPPSLATRAMPAVLGLMLLLPRIDLVK